VRRLPLIAEVARPAPWHPDESEDDPLKIALTGEQTTELARWRRDSSLKLAERD
jgi:hypothetical protein